MIKIIFQVLEFCTQKWAQPAVGRLGSKSANTVNLEEVADLKKPIQNTLMAGLASHTQRACGMRCWKWFKGCRFLFLYFIFNTCPWSWLIYALHTC